MIRRLPLITLMLLLIWLPPSNSQQKKFDVAGYTDYKWGTRLQTVIDDLRKQHIDFELSDVPRSQNEKYVTYQTSIRLEETTGSSWQIEKTFVFYYDSLIKVVLIKEEPVMKERLKTIHQAFKRVLSEKYGRPSVDTILYPDKEYGGPYCEWAFKTTSISLSLENFAMISQVRILYELTGIEDLIDQELKQQSTREF